MKKLLQRTVFTIGVLALAVFPLHAEDHDHAEDAHHEEAGHEHQAPHGGTLIVFGEEFAHLELVLNAEEGILTGYALDGGAEYAVRLKQTEIVLEVKAEGQTEGFEVRLNSKDNPLSGETVGDSSEFAGADERLKGLEHFQGSIRSLEIKGQVFENVAFDFPEGNE